MPNYDVRCATCHRESKVRGSMTDKAQNRIPCPHCGATELITLFKTPPGVLKGAPCPTQGTSHGCAGCPHAS